MIRRRCFGILIDAWGVPPTVQRRSTFIRGISSLAMLRAPRRSASLTLERSENFAHK